MSENRYIDDNTIYKPYHDEGNITSDSFLIGAAALSGAFLSYKYGALKKVSKKILEQQANTILERSKSIYKDMSQDIDNYKAEKVISKFKPKPYKKVSNKSPVSPKIDFKASSQQGNYFVINDNTSLKDVFQRENAHTTKRFFKQYAASFDGNYENINNRTDVLFFLLERMNQTTSSVGLGLSLESSKNAIDIGKNLILKRFLSIYTAYQDTIVIGALTTHEEEDDTINSTPFVGGKIQYFEANTMMKAKADAAFVGNMIAKQIGFKRQLSSESSFYLREQAKAVISRVFNLYGADNSNDSIESLDGGVVYLKEQPSNQDIKAYKTNSGNISPVALVTGDIGAGDTLTEKSGYSAFWDEKIGSFGSDISEIFRRFVQKRRNNIDHYNPIRNTMPEWLPGEDSERMHDLQYDKMLEMQMGSSTIGKTKDEIVRHILKQDSITDKEMHKIVKTGNRVHETIEGNLLKAGIAIDTEQEIKDNEMGIVGYYDVRMRDSTSPTGEAIMDIKTISDKGFKQVVETGVPKDEHQRQVNWYLHHTNKDNKGYLMYVNRDDPKQVHTMGFKYDEELYKSSMETVKAARKEVNDMLDRRIISRADLYKPIDRFRILADVAPFSDEYRQMSKEMSAMQLKGEDKEELRRITDRVEQQKKQTRFYDYRFKNNDTLKEDVEISHQIDGEKFVLNDTDNTVIKLSGVKINKDSENYQKAMEFLQEHLSDGENVTIEYAKDANKRRNKDISSSMDVVIHSDGMNINRELVKRELAEEDTDDYSATGVKARFNEFQRAFGSAWENIAHYDSFANTKLLQVRTVAEDYERKQLYDKDFKEWSEPYEDWLKPFAWSNINRQAGTLFGAGIGSKFGKILGTVTGASVLSAGKLYKAGHEATTGEKWIPEEKRRQRELNEYVDKLKFVKNRRLFEVYAEKALKEDNFDVKTVIEKNYKSGKYKSIKLKETKADRDASIKNSISEGSKISQDRRVFEIPYNALKSIHYYNESEKTMYSYDQSALPKKDRMYFRDFMEAPEEERENILEMTPKYMKRAFQSAYRLRVDPKENLDDYFSNHYLPSEDWDGWQENYDLESMKVKLVQSQDMEISHFDIWEDDKLKADMYGPTAIPNMDYSTRNLQTVRNKLKKVLGEAGYEDIDVSFTFGSNKPSINLNMYEDRKEKYEAKFKERLGI